MKTRAIKDNEILPIGSIVIHTATFEIGIVEGECLGFGKCKVIYHDHEMWYPQTKRNIRLILKESNRKLEKITVCDSCHSPNLPKRIRRKKLTNLNVENMDAPKSKCWNNIYIKWKDQHRNGGLSFLDWVSLNYHAPEPIDIRSKILNTLISFSDDEIDITEARDLLVELINKTK